MILPSQGCEACTRPVWQAKREDPAQPAQACFHLIKQDALVTILTFLAADDLLAFSLCCTRFNAERKRHGLALRTSLAWTLVSSSVSAWSESIGCPTPSYWAELHGLSNDSYNGLIVKVLRAPGPRDRQVVCLHSSLSSPDMQRCSPGLRAYSLEAPHELDRDKGLGQRALVLTKNIRVLQPHEISRAKVLFFTEEALPPAEAKSIVGRAAKFVQLAAHFNQGESQLGKILLSKPALCVVGGDMHLLGGLSGPMMSGVEISLGQASQNLDIHDLRMDAADAEEISLEIRGGRPFEVLEILNEDYIGHPSIRETLLGRARIFHARIRWIHCLPPRNPLSPPAEVMTRCFI